MKTLRLAFLLAALALPGAAAAAPAAAQPNDAYQFTFVSGSAVYGTVTLRVAVATGQSALSSSGTAFINVVDSTPPGPGDYRLYSWASYDATGARTSWAVSRVDLQSGRLWGLTYDGKSAANWTPITGP
jgi:hypothetical protein